MLLSRRRNKNKKQKMNPFWLTLRFPVYSSPSICFCSPCNSHANSASCGFICWLFNTIITIVIVLFNVMTVITMQNMFLYHFMQLICAAQHRSLVANLGRHLTISTSMCDVLGSRMSKNLF